MVNVEDAWQERAGPLADNVYMCGVGPSLVFGTPRNYLS